MSSRTYKEVRHSQRLVDLMARRSNGATHEMYVRVTFRRLPRGDYSQERAVFQAKACALKGKMKATSMFKTCGIGHGQSPTDAFGEAMHQLSQKAR